MEATAAVEPSFMVGYGQSGGTRPERTVGAIRDGLLSESTGLVPVVPQLAAFGIHAEYVMRALDIWRLAWFVVPGQPDADLACRNPFAGIIRNRSDEVILCDDDLDRVRTIPKLVEPLRELWDLVAWHSAGR